MEIGMRRGDTWPKLMRALGSSKPWVPRSLRSWAVVFLPKKVLFGWRWAGDGMKTALDPTFFTDVMVYLTLGKLKDQGETHVGRFGGVLPCDKADLRCCDKDDSAWVFSLSPTWVTSRGLGGGEIKIPTALFIEAMRILRRRQRSSVSEYVPKRVRSARRRFRNQMRKDYQDVRGDHQRWTNIAKFLRMVQESSEVKTISPEELAAGQLVMIPEGGV